MSPRTTALVAVATVLLGVVAVGKMMLGDFPISPLEVITAVAGGGSDHEGFIVRSLRLPRVPVGAGAGVALAASGSIFQGLVRNPLVAPDIIGVMAGATVAAVTAIVVFQSATVVPVAAFLGAVIATFVVYGLTWQKGITGGTPETVTAVGVPMAQDERDGIHHQCPQHDGTRRGHFDLEAGLPAFDEVEDLNRQCSMTPATVRRSLSASGRPGLVLIPARVAHILLPS